MQREREREKERERGRGEREREIERKHVQKKGVSGCMMILVCYTAACNADNDQVDLQSVSQVVRRHVLPRPLLLPV
jgi:hypothetical protein